MKKKKKIKKYYFTSIGEIIWTIASYIYCAWYIWFHFLLSNPVFGDVSKVTLFLMFWVGSAAVLVSLFKFKDGPQFLYKPKFENTDLFTLVVIGIAIFFGLR